MAPNWPPDDQRQATEQSNSIPSGSHEEQVVSDANSQESPTLSSQFSPAPPGPQLVAKNQPGPPSSLAIWIDRLGLVIRVVFYIELGMLLAVLPWTRLWTDNSLAANLPGLREMMQINFIRGLISGIGLVDIWIGVWEAVRYREGNKA